MQQSLRVHRRNSLPVLLLGPVNTSNNVEATFDTVERIVQLVSFDNVASILLLVWAGL